MTRHIISGQQSIESAFGRVRLASRGWRLIEMLCFVLAGLIGTGLVGFLLFNNFGKGDSSFSLSDLEVSSSGFFVKNALYQGKNSDGPYEFRAARSFQSFTNPSRLEMTRPTIETKTDHDGWMFVTGQTGQLDRTTRILTFEHDVKIFHNSGYELHTTHIETQLGTNRFKSDQPVHGFGPLGKLQGEGMVVEEGLVHLTGKSSLLIYAEDEQ
ncbi:MAG: LPS export ABC transporter periplasmic protein LptC [Pseudomonadota bacterium]